MAPWYPMGKGSMLQAANLLLHTAHLSGYQQIFELYDMITVNSAKTMYVQDRYGIEIGKPAVIVLNAANEMDAIRLMSECLYVVNKGKIVAQTSPARSEINFSCNPEQIDFLVSVA